MAFKGYIYTYNDNPAQVPVGGRVYTSADAGVTWVERTSVPFSDWWTIACSSDGMVRVECAFYSFYGDDVCVDGALENTLYAS